MTNTLSPAPAGLPPAYPTAPGRARWADALGLGALLAGTAALYLTGLAASGWANAYYAAAAQAGARSWTAWFFGSSDAANAITIDKPPGALWVTGLAVRIFGLSSWSILVPQALMGVATVALTYAAVRRTAGPAAGLLAGAALALTPVAVLMFRFNNPDALLTLLLVGAAAATLRAVEHGSARWLVLAAALVGFGFLTKMLQAYLVLPALAGTWLLAAPVGLGQRLRGLALAAAALLLSSFWWVLVVQLWPADRRPYIGGSQTNSVLELMLGYNGFGRLTGDEVGSVGAGPGGGWGATGFGRLFDAQLGGAASWLLPAATVLLGVLLWRTRRAPRTDRLRAAAVLWSGWLVVTAAVFSLMAGIFHDYYLVALAPPIAALVGIGALTCWRERAAPAIRLGLAGVVALTTGWAVVLLRRTPDWLPWLAWVVLGLGGLATLGLVLVGRQRANGTLGQRAWPRGPFARGRWGVVAAVVAVLAGLAGPAGYAVATAATPHSGAIPSVGPAGAGLRGGSGPGRLGRLGPQTGGGPIAPGAGAGATPPPALRPGRGPGGGLLGSPTPGPAVVAMLARDAADHTWAAAAVGSNTAAGYQLASGLPVLAVGGFNGTDPAPTLERFQQLVAAGRVHWFVGTGANGPLGDPSSGGSDQARRITEWVTSHYRPLSVDGTTLYDLSAGTPR